MKKYFSQFIAEALKSTTTIKPIVISWGRLNPPTLGHGKLLDALAKTAKGNTPYRMFITQTVDKKKNPLTHAEKVAFTKEMFPKHAPFIETSTKYKILFDVLAGVYSEGYTDLIMVVGSDRIMEFQTLVNKYNGLKAKHGFYEFNSIEIVSAGERDPDSEGVSGMSASKMRQAALDNDFELFKTGVPSNFKSAKKLFSLLQDRLKT